MSNHLSKGNCMNHSADTQIEYVAVHGGMYLLAHEIKSKKNGTFQGAVMDEQFIIFPVRDNEADTQEDYDFYIDGFDDTYGDTTIYFVPTKDIQVAKDKVQGILSKWKNHGEHILDFDEGVIYIAYKNTASGMWVFISDHTGNDTFYGVSFNIFDDIANVVSVADTDIVCDNMTFYVTGTPSESSGPDFYNSLLRENDPIVALMVAEGIVFEDVDEPEEED
jgi:hypothetical protein